ncbi:MAG: T9SS type A sorting domain-containing protein [Bacteroidia bacterium]|nr:T9SS type A sorting domain-containing protein [Bacteroidia bacterium]
MKKILQTLVFILATQAVFSQAQCQAYFTYYYNGVSLLSLNDASYNTDSSTINVTAWSWTADFGGVSYTYNTANPVVQVGNYAGLLTACLTISTSDGCTSTLCDTSIYIIPYVISCHAEFSWQPNGILYNYTLSDYSSAGNPASGASITSWSWIITDNLQNTLFTSTIQNPAFTFPGIGYYHVCLTINTDIGCTDTQCHSINLNDSMLCNLDVFPNISNVTVIGGNDGFIDLTVMGANTPFIFNWSNGEITEDIYGLTSGYYTVTIGQNDSVCPPINCTFQILEPFQNVPIDTLMAIPIDSCLNFTVDSFSVASISVQGSVVTVIWILTGSGMTVTFPVTYVFSNYGPYMVVLQIICGKSSETYTTYINITSHLGIDNPDLAEINTYPDPFTGSFNLNIPDVSNAEIRIFNSTGQLIYSVRTANMRNQVNASHWPAGMYFVRVTNGNKQLVTRIVVKQ